jgi:nucleoside-diphosphate-sugar epimerase
MKAFVTGATGFVGSHVADLLLERGFEVRCAVRASSSLQWLDGKPLELVKTDFNSIDSIKSAIKDCDYIFHVGGSVAARNLEEFMHSNRDTTRNLLTACEQSLPNLKRFVYVSSQTAVGPSPSADHPLDETAECHPITAYGKSKFAAEQEVHKFAGRIPFTIIRPPAVYGPRDPNMLQIFQIVNKGLATLIGFNKKFVSLVHSDDLVRGICDCITTDKTIGETYFVSSEEFYTWGSTMDIIKNAAGRKFVFKLHVPHSVVMTAAFFSEFFGRFAKKPPIFNLDKGRDFIQSYWICSVEKAKRDFNYKQNVSLERGMNETINWYKEHNLL